LIRPHTPIVLAPAVLCLFCNLHLADRVNRRLSLLYKYINLAKLGDNLCGLISFGTHYQSSQNHHNGWTN